MRDQLNSVVKEFLQSKLKEVKKEKRLTQEEMANILQMERRTLSGVMRGEYSFGGLSTLLFLAFLTKDCEKEIEVLRGRFLEVLGEDWERQLKETLRER